jgi:hypothetical protein
MPDDFQLPPALQAFGVTLIARAGDPLPARPRLRRALWRRPRMGTAVAFVALAGVGSGLAGAAGVFNTAQPTSPNTQQVAPLAQEPDQVDYTMLGILRRPQQPGDALPPTQDRTQDPEARSTGANPQLARRVSFGPLGDAWVIPADGGVCLQSQGGGCDLDVDGHPPYIQMLGAGVAHPGLFHITGLVPDGVTSVELHFDDGTVDELAVKENVYMANVTQGFSSTTFTLSDGTPITLPGEQVSPSQFTGCVASSAGTGTCPSSGAT